MKKIDLVMFVYNEEKYINEQLKSLLNQKKFINKVIIIDDFSTDNTKNEIMKFMNKLNIIYKMNDKKGKINALAKGLSLVELDYFLVCAGDDKFVDNVFEKLLNYINKLNIDFCYLNYYLTDQNLNVISISQKKEYYSYKVLFYKNFVSGYLFGKKSIIKTILPVNEKIPFEDWYMVLKLAIKYKKIYVFKEPAFYYRRHLNSTTYNTKSKEKYLHLIKRDLKLFKYIQKEAYFKYYKQYIDIKILYLELLLDKKQITLDNLKKIFFNKFIPIKDKFKVLIFNYYLKWKYDD